MRLSKPLNVWDLKRDVMYKNDEMYNLMQSLNVEDNTGGVRRQQTNPFRLLPERLDWRHEKVDGYPAPRRTR